MVNTENMQKWIDGLRSGEYQQIQGWLETTEGNCAMGVLCRVAIESGVRMEISEGWTGETGFDGAYKYMPWSAHGWLGLGSCEAIMIGDCDVATLNDHGMSFDQIADGLYEQYVKEPEDG